MPDFLISLTKFYEETTEKGEPAPSLLGLVAFHIIPVSCGRARRGFRLCRLLRWAQASGTEVATIFHVVVLRQRRNHGGAAFDLADAVQDDFGAAVVGFEGSVDFDGAAGEAADVADVFQVVRKDDDCEGTRHLVFTEIEEVDTFGADFYADDFSRHAFGFSDVLSGLVNGDAVSGAGGRNREEKQ